MLKWLFSLGGSPVVLVMSLMIMVNFLLIVCMRVFGDGNQVAGAVVIIVPRLRLLVDWQGKSTLSVDFQNDIYNSSIIRPYERLWSAMGELITQISPVVPHVNFQYMGIFIRQNKVG